MEQYKKVIHYRPLIYLTLSFSLSFSLFFFPLARFSPLICFAVIRFVFLFLLFLSSLSFFSFLSSPSSFPFSLFSPSSSSTSSLYILFAIHFLSHSISHLSRASHSQPLSLSTPCCALSPLPAFFIEYRLASIR